MTTTSRLAQKDASTTLLSDAADLIQLDEIGVYNLLRQRYQDNAIYTYSGPFLVALNPFEPLPLYGPDFIRQYRRGAAPAQPGQRAQAQPSSRPHIYAVAERAWRAIEQTGKAQSLLVTGESGAGKTQTTIWVLQYLVGAADAAATPAASELDLGQLILQANPLLEAFGNAQTSRNSNSSRFGKLVRVFVCADGGAIAGADIETFLLEVPRVHAHARGERNFHIFYQLLQSGDAALLSSLSLEGTKAADWAILRAASRSGEVGEAAQQHAIEASADASGWRTVEAAWGMLGVSPQERLAYLRILAAILHAGEVRVEAGRATQASLPALQAMAKLLGVPETELLQALLRPRIRAGSQWVEQSRTAVQVHADIAALCKTLYERLFSAIVARTNAALAGGRNTSTAASSCSFIGVLDLAGFEIVVKNSLDQFLINFTNEKLQQLFNHHAFTVEQDEYAREEIGWEVQDYGLDLQPTISVIEGALQILDDHTVLGSSEKEFLSKCSGAWAKTGGKQQQQQQQQQEPFKADRFGQGFTISHYAGAVQYDTSGWIDKNRDPQSAALLRILAQSSDEFVASLFTDLTAQVGGAVPSPEGAAPSARHGRRVGGGRGAALRTISQKHRSSLESLLQKLSDTQPHFVRCMLPNTQRTPGVVEQQLVLEQMRCNGIVEGVRLAQRGYPSRMLFAKFCALTEYGLLLPVDVATGKGDEWARTASRRILEAMHLDQDLFRIGLTKVYLKSGVLSLLQTRKDDRLSDIFSRVQACCRKFMKQRVMKRWRAARVIQRTARAYAEITQWPWWDVYLRLRPLLSVEGRYNREREQRRNVQREHDEQVAQLEARIAALEADALGYKEREGALEMTVAQTQEDLERERIARVEGDEALTKMEHLLVESRVVQSGLQGEVDALQASVERQVEEARAEMAGRLAQANQRQEDLELQRAQRTEASSVDAAAAEQACTELRAALVEAKTEAKRAEQAEEVQRASVERLVSERDGLRHRLAEGSKDLETARARITKLQAQLLVEEQAKAEALGKAAELDEGLRNAQSLASTLASRVTAAEAAREDEAARLAALTAQGKRQHSDAKKEISTLAVRLASIESERSGLAARLACAESGLQRGLAEQAELQSALVGKTAENADLSRELSEATAQLAEQVAARRALDEELGETKRTYQGLREYNKELRRVENDFMRAQETCKLAVREAEENEMSSQ